MSEQHEPIVDLITSAGTRITDEWQTPPEWIDRFGRILGSIGLDPCWSKIDGQRYEPYASTTWGMDDNALAKSPDEWQAHGSIFMNPPYSEMMKWARQLAWCDEVEWIALCNTSSASRWWQLLAQHATVVAFPSRRIAFVDPVSAAPSTGNRYDQTIFARLSPGKDDLIDETLGLHCTIFHQQHGR
jgi:hypothetical protein